MIKNIEKIVYILINLLVLLGFVLFVCFNFNKTTEFFCPIMGKVYSTKLVLLTGIQFLAAYISGYILCLIFKQKADKLCDAYQKRHESISVAKDTDAAKIAALEAKIETLEVALETALKNK